MPLCGTFHYAGIVPKAKADCESGSWRLQDQSGARLFAKFDSLKLWKSDSLRDNRLVGLQPTLRVSGGQLVLSASGKQRAEIRSASLDLDPSFVEGFQGGDLLTLVRSGTADIGISLLRVDELVCAVGAVTLVPLGKAIGIDTGSNSTSSSPASPPWPRKDTWIEISYSGQVSRLRAGDRTAIGDWEVSVVRCFQDGLPGSYENAAISSRGICPHDAAIRSARLLARPNAGLALTNL